MICTYIYRLLTQIHTILARKKLYLMYESIGLFYSASKLNVQNQHAVA